MNPHDAKRRTIVDRWVEVFELVNSGDTQRLAREAHIHKNRLLILVKSIWYSGVLFWRKKQRAIGTSLPSISQTVR